MDIHLLSLPYLSLDYSNVIDFKDNDSRRIFFEKNTKKTLKNINIKYDAERINVVVPLKVEECRGYDYLYYVDSWDKPWYYFITNIEMVTQNTTRFYLTLDIWTSYLFTYTILPSFIDRCHVPRWNGDKPTYNMENEDIEIGEYIQKENPTDIYEMSKSVVVASSVPIGYVYKPSGGTGIGGNTRGVISSKGFRFIKGYEGFAPYGAYLSVESFRTVGYGSTEKYNLDYYNKHKPFPCSEKLASEIYLERITNEFGNGVWKALQDNGVDSQVTSNQFDAMCSLAYNRGLGGFLNDSTSPWKLIKTNPNDPTIKDKWQNYAITGSGVELPGLVARRKAETDIYFNNEYEMRTIGKYNESGSLVGSLTENNGDGYIPSSLTENGDNTSDIQLSIVNSGTKLIGKPYVWGGNYPPLGNSPGTDCSGFCQWCYNDNGKGDLISGRWTTESIGNSGKSVSKNEIQLADLILTPGHVVMYSGFRGGKHYIMEAPRTGLNIREREYSFPTNIISIRRLL